MGASENENTSRLPEGYFKYMFLPFLVTPSRHIPRFLLLLSTHALFFSVFCIYMTPGLLHVPYVPAWWTSVHVLLGPREQANIDMKLFMCVVDV